MQSEHINDLSAALAKAQGAMKTASFNRTNPHFKSKYADLASVLEAIREPLASNGLSITQTTQLRDAGLVLVTALRHASGQWIESEYPLPATVRPQELGSALTYARRYSLSAITCIAADDDDDGNAAEAAATRGKPKPPAANVMRPETSAVSPTQAEPPAPPPIPPAPLEKGAGESSDVMECDRSLAEAAEKGTDALAAAWGLMPDGHKKTLKAALDRRHKPRAAEVDARDRS